MKGKNYDNHFMDRLSGCVYHSVHTFFIHFSLILWKHELKDLFFMTIFWFGYFLSSKSSNLLFLYHRLSLMNKNIYIYIFEILILNYTFVRMGKIMVSGFKILCIVSDSSTNYCLHAVFWKNFETLKRLLTTSEIVCVVVISSL